MPYVLKEFINVVNKITEFNSPIKIYVSNYSRRNVLKKGDFEIYLSDEDGLVKVKDDLEKSNVRNEIDKFILNSSNLIIHFKRQIICENVINEILDFKNNYGFQIRNLEPFLINDYKINPESDLTELRHWLFYHQLIQLMNLSGLDVITNEETHAATKRITCRVGNVHIINSKIQTIEEFKKCCSNLLIKSSEHKTELLSTEDGTVTANVLASTLDACIKFNLLFVKPNKNITLDLSENNLRLIKAGSFVMYNYARLASLLHRFDKLVESGYYPPMPEINKIHFSLLKREDEWFLIRDYLMYFPLLVDEILNEINGQPPVYKFQHFLLSLSHKISTYYSKVRILMDQMDHLMPQIFVRIALLKAILQVMTNCLRVMDIIPITKM